MVSRRLHRDGHAVAKGLPRKLGLLVVPSDRTMLGVITSLLIDAIDNSPSLFLNVGVDHRGDEPHRPSYAVPAPDVRAAFRWALVTLGTSATGASSRRSSRKGVVCTDASANAGNIRDRAVINITTAITRTGFFSSCSLHLHVYFPAITAGRGTETKYLLLNYNIKKCGWQQLGRLLVIDSFVIHSYSITQQIPNIFE